MPFFPTHHTARAADAADISALASNCNLTHSQYPQNRQKRLPKKKKTLLVPY